MTGKVVGEVAVGVKMMARWVVTVDLREKGAVVGIGDAGVIGKDKLGALATGVVVALEGGVIGECFAKKPSFWIVGTVDGGVVDLVFDGLNLVEFVVVVDVVDIGGKEGGEAVEGIVGMENGGGIGFGDGLKQTFGRIGVGCDFLFWCGVGFNESEGLFFGAVLPGCSGNAGCLVVDDGMGAVATEVA